MEDPAPFLSKTVPAGDLPRFIPIVFGLRHGRARQFTLTVDNEIEEQQ
jgi:hypothetical protein